jgi:hypothetical protein
MPKRRGVGVQSELGVRRTRTETPLTWVSGRLTLGLGRRTHGQLVVNSGLLVMLARYLEPIWGSTELLRFMLLV